MAAGGASCGGACVSTDETTMPETGLDTTDTAYVADRADIFRTALALVRDGTWEGGLAVVDVVRVAEFLAGDGLR